MHPFYQQEQLEYLFFLYLKRIHWSNKTTLSLIDLVRDSVLNDEKCDAHQNFPCSCRLQAGLQQLNTSHDMLTHFNCCVTAEVCFQWANNFTLHFHNFSCLSITISNAVVIHLHQWAIIVGVMLECHIISIWHVFTVKIQ